MIFQTIYAANSGGKKPKMPPPYSVDHPGRNGAPQQRPEPTNDPARIKQFFTKHFGRR